MLRTLLALAGLLLLAPATASAASFGELPFHPVKGAAMCLQATGAPGELVHQTPTEAQLLTAGPTGLTPAVALSTDGALDCVDVAAWPGGGGLVTFPVSAGFDSEVWVRGFLREPGQAWGEAIEILPPKSRLIGGTFVSAASERGDALVAMSTVDEDARAELSVARRLPGGAFGAPERLLFEKTRSEDPALVHAGYSASGEVVLTWTRQARGADSPLELWAASAPPGAPFGAPQKLAPIDEDTPYTLAVGADGRALVVFASAGRLVAAERTAGGSFGATSVLAKTIDRLGSQPVAILRPGGGAIVAWTSPSTASFTARTREQAGAFGQTITLASPKQLDRAARAVQQRFVSGASAGNTGVAPQAVLGADGRVLLTWSHLGLRQGIWRILPATAVLGFAGNEWEIDTYGGPLRNADAVAPVLLADGSRAVAWVDNSANETLGRVHLAREGTPDSANPKAPKVTVIAAGSRRLKSEDPLRLRVTCDAACDVFAELAGSAETNASLSLAAAGSRWLTLYPSSGPIAPRHPGKVRVILRSGAPGARRATARTLAVSLRRAPIAYPPRALGVTVTPDGDDLIVRWHTAKPAAPNRYVVWAVDEDGEPVSSAESGRGPRRTNFEVRVKDARGATHVIVYELAANSPDARRTTVKVPG